MKNMSRIDFRLTMQDYRGHQLTKLKRFGQGDVHWTSYQCACVKCHEHFMFFPNGDNPYFPGKNIVEETSCSAR